MSFPVNYWKRWTGRYFTTSPIALWMHLATVHINYLQIKQSFTTENVRQPPHNIAMTLQDGPFRTLDGNWHFIALSPTACKIEFKLHYEFSNKLLEKMVGPVFHLVANSFVDAFTHRAEKVYVAK